MIDKEENEEMIEQTIEEQPTTPSDEATNQPTGEPTESSEEKINWEIPTDDAPDEHWTKFREGIRPSKYEEYDFGDTGKENPEGLNKIKEVFWNAGIPNRMARGLLENITTYEQEYIQNQTQSMQEIVQRAEEDLGKEYEGGTKRINQILLDKITEVYGAEDAQQVLGSMTGNIAVKKMLIDSIMNTSKGRGFVKGETPNIDNIEEKLSRFKNDEKFMEIARDKSHRDYDKHNEILSNLVYERAMQNKNK